MSKSKVQNCISEKYGFYPYQRSDSRCNLCVWYIQECSSFITSNGYNWKVRCDINCHSINVLSFLSCNSCDGNTTYTGKTVNFRHSKNNHKTACRCGIPTNKFDNHVFKWSKRNERVAKKPYFKVYAFMTVKNENQLLFYESYLHKMGFDKNELLIVLLLLLLLFISRIKIKTEREQFFEANNLLRYILTQDLYKVTKFV